MSNKECGVLLVLCLEIGGFRGSLGSGSISVRCLELRVWRG